nr:MAG TPA: hypothetical protein [Caudoviricetes sp.]
MLAMGPKSRPEQAISGVFSLDIRDHVLVSLFLRFITHIFSPKFIASGMVLFHNCLSQLSV